MQQLTDVQRKLAEEHHSLIYSFAALHKLAPDEWYDVLAIGYVKGIAVYDPAKGALSTITYRAMRAEWLKAVRAKNCLKRSGAVCSLDMERGESLCLYDCLEDKQDDISDTITGIDFARALEPVSECGRLLLLLRASGITGREIAARLHVSGSTISRWYQDLKIQLKEVTDMEAAATANKNSPPRTYWTPDLVAELRKLAAENKTPKELAQHFGVSVACVSSAMSRNGIYLSPHKDAPKHKKHTPSKEMRTLYSLTSEAVEKLEAAIGQLRANDSFGWYNMGVAICTLKRIQYELSMQCYGKPPLAEEKGSAPLELQLQQGAQEITSLSV